MSRRTKTTEGKRRKLVAKAALLIRIPYARPAQVLLLLLLLAVPIAFSADTADRFTEIKWSILQLVIPFLLALVLLAIGPIARGLVKAPMFVPAVIYVACNFVSILFATNRAWAARSAVNQAYMLGLFVASYALAATGLSARKALIAIVIASSIVSLLGVIQYHELLGQRRLADSYGELQTPSTIGHNNFAAAYVIMAIPATIALLISVKTVFGVSAVGLGLAVQLYYLLLTASRGGWMGFGVSMLFWAIWGLLSRRKRSKAVREKSAWPHKAMIVVLPIVTAAVVLILASPPTHDLVTGKAASTTDLSDKPIQFRLLTWKSTLAMIADHPMGVGLANYEMRYPEYRSVEEHRMTGRFRKVKRTHNEYLQTAAEQGPYGLIAFLFLIAAFFRVGFRTVRMQPVQSTRLMYQSILTGQMAVLVHSFFSFPLQLPVTSMMFWVFCALVQGPDKRLLIQSRGPVRYTSSRLSTSHVSLAIGIICIVSLVQLSASGLISDYHHTRGLSFKDRKEFDKAAAEFKRAAEFRDSDFLNHYLASVCLRNAGELEEAIDENLKSLRLNENDRHSLFNLGALYSYKGEQNKDKALMSEAIKLWQRVLSIDPDYSQAYFNMGAVYAHQGQLGRAVTAYENALRIDPKLFQACHNMIMILEHDGKLREAQTSLLECMKNVQDPQLYLDLARIYVKLGEIGNAQSTLTEAKELFSQNEQIDRALSAVSQ